METIQNMQLKERISGTLLRLGWLVCIATFVPMLSYLMYAAFAVARILYLFVLVILILATAFLILLSEGFRNAFDSESVDVLPMIQSVYQNYSAIIYIFLVVGIALGVLTILLAIKENNGKSSRKKVILSGVMIALTVIGAIVYLATKSKVLGV
ncbi:MAG: hypothetical protein K2I23_01555 [Clostridia bacterium]|nr:hypothetical protein [Clostridia bacterium]